MTARDMCYWLQGYLELSDCTTEGATPETMILIQKHLAMVFIHEIDPSFPVEQQEALNTIHNDDRPHSKARC